MNFEITITNIGRNLISAYAALDSWIDKLFDASHQHDEDAFEIIYHVLNSNDHLLRTSLKEYKHDLSTLIERQEVDDTVLALTRRMLREQLYCCLLLLDALEVDANKNTEMMESLYTICYHLHHHLEELDHTPICEVN